MEDSQRTNYDNSNLQQQVQGSLDISGVLSIGCGL